jgi:quercetin dioxygenase-like cupin family protein
MNLTDLTEKGVVYINGTELKKASDTEWVNHPKFSGVMMKHLFTGNECYDALSAMLVKIKPRHEIGNHIHEGKAELHQVISGNGTAKIGNICIDYKPGVISLIPSDIPHGITAGDEGLVLLAEFTPPLN